VLGARCGASGRDPDTVLIDDAGLAYCKQPILGKDFTRLNEHDHRSCAGDRNILADQPAPQIFLNE
jgi:hypothetical protein